MKRMPWWGWLVFLGLPVLIPLLLVYLMVVALPLCVIVTMCDALGWEAPSWVYRLAGYGMVDKSFK